MIPTQPLHDDKYPNYCKICLDLPGQRHSTELSERRDYREWILLHISAA